MNFIVYLKARKSKKNNFRGEINMIYCDKCEHEFKPNLKMRNRGVSVKETYFRCPKCRKHYTAFYTNQEARRLQRVIKSLTKQGKYPEVQKAKQELAVIMAELKQKFGA